MVNEIFVLYLVYNAVELEKDSFCMKSIAARMFPEAKINFIIVDNALDSGYVDKKSATCFLIGGDNRCSEFSGWDHGVSFIKQQFNLSDSTVVMFANDTIMTRSYTSGPSYLDVFDAPILAGRDVTQSAIGYVDDFPRLVKLNGIKYNSWIRSNIFCLPLSIVNVVSPLTVSFSMEQVFSSDINQFWSSSELISDNWKAYISSWLFGIESSAFPEYKLHWLKAGQLNEDNWEFFKKKALCILSEHYLSARLYKLEIPIINTNIFEKKNDRHIFPYYQQSNSKKTG